MSPITLLDPILRQLDSVHRWLSPLGLRLILAWEYGEAGLTKLQGQNWFGSIQHKFPPPLRWIDPELSWWLATWTELAAAAALVLGLFTRFAAYALFVLTFVAVAAVHWPAEWSSLTQLWEGYAIRNTGAGNYKLPLLFALMLLPLVLGGAGRFSLDALLARGRRPSDRADAGAWALAALALGLPLMVLLPWVGGGLLLTSTGLAAWRLNAGDVAPGRAR